MSLPTYIPGYNITLHVDAWYSIACMMPEDLAQYIADEIAGSEGYHTIYGISPDELQQIIDSIQSLYQQIITETKVACQGADVVGLA